MSISYPLTFPTSRGAMELAFRALSVVGVQASPLTLEHTIYAWPGDGWEADVDLPPMTRANAEDWIGFLLSLNGQEGTFTMGDPVNTTPRGTWSGQSPLVNGAHAAGLKSIDVKSAGASKTWKRGDWLQFGSALPRLHKIVADGSSGAGGTGTIEIWPRTRAALADGDAITIASPKGTWRLASNTTAWDLKLAQLYGLRFTCIEARDG